MTEDDWMTGVRDWYDLFGSLLEHGSISPPGPTSRSYLASRYISLPALSPLPSST